MQTLFQKCTGNGGSETRFIPGKWNKVTVLKYTKMTVLTVTWTIFTFLLILEREPEHRSSLVSIPPKQPKVFSVGDEKPETRFFVITFKGALAPEHSETANKLQVKVQLSETGLEEDLKEITPIHEFSLLEDTSKLESSKSEIREHTFEISQENLDIIQNSNSKIFFGLSTNIDVELSVEIRYNLSAGDPVTGIILGAVILIGMYIFIVFEIIHRTFAAMLASTMTIAVLASRNDRPTMEEIFEWIDVETLLLLFSMMILVAIMSQTGFFDYTAVLAFKVTAGKVWPLIGYLCLFTAILTMFLDCVTTVLMMTPVVIRICEVAALNPVPVLMIMLFCCNLSGIATPIGDPPNIMIISNSYFSTHGITFFAFVCHMFIGVCILLAVGYAMMRFCIYRDLRTFYITEDVEIRELRREIMTWRNAAQNMVPAYSMEEDMVRATMEQKIETLNEKMNQKIRLHSKSTEAYRLTLKDLEEKFPIRDKSLLIKCVVIIAFVVVLFFVHSIPNVQNLSFGWTALVGVMLLLIVADEEDIEHCLHHVEWSTLLFFAALFVLMEGLGKLGLIYWLGKQTQNVIESVSEKAYLPVAVLLIMWVSALVSAFLDNIPLTSMMIKIIISLAENKSLGLPLQPLVYALAFGSGLGANGTLIGASSNIVCAGLAENHGYFISFNYFMKIGIPLMLGTGVAATGYLMFCHVAISWH